MTEIPEHLLKRAAERRAAKSGEAAPADAPAEAAPAADAGAATPAAAVAKAPKAPAPLPTLDDGPAKAKPDSAVVAAAKRRKRIPFWAAGVLAALPLWGVVYVASIQEPPAGDNDPIALGAEVFAVTGGCAGCHSGSGAGSATGQQLNDGHAYMTFKDPLAMVHWIYYGADGGARPDGTYGDLDRPGGPMDLNQNPGKMAAPKLSPKELAAVTIYVRSTMTPDYDPENEQGFTAEAFEADHAAIEAQVQAVIDLGEGGDPDLSGIERGAE